MAIEERMSAWWEPIQESLAISLHIPPGHTPRVEVVEHDGLIIVGVTRYLYATPESVAALEQLIRGARLCLYKLRKKGIASGKLPDDQQRIDLHAGPQPGGSSADDDQPGAPDGSNGANG